MTTAPRCAGSGQPSPIPLPQAAFGILGATCRDCGNLVTPDAELHDYDGHPGGLFRFRAHVRWHRGDHLAAWRYAVAGWEA